MTPFLYHEIFEISNNIIGNIKTINNTKILVLDNVFKNFNKLQKIVFSTPVGNWKFKNGTKNYIDYYDCRLSFLPKQDAMIALAKDSISLQYSHKTFLQNSVDVNWFKQINKKRNNYAIPHIDTTEKKSYTCLVYLNSIEDCFGGTAFFNQIKEDFAIEDLDYWGANQECWEKIGYIDMQPNRMVIFPSELFHSAYHPNDWYFDNPRLTLVFWMEVL